MPRELPPLDEHQRTLIAKALVAWAEYHPYPNLPIIQLANGSELTPRDIAGAATEPKSPRGLLLHRVFSAALIPDDIEPAENLQDILSDYWSDAERWRIERSR